MSDPFGRPAWIIRRCAWCCREAICRNGSLSACEDHADARHDPPPADLDQPDPFDVER